MTRLLKILLFWARPGDPQDGSDIPVVPEMLRPPPPPDWPPPVVVGTPFVILLPGHVRATPGKKSKIFPDGSRVEEWRVNRETAEKASTMLRLSRIPHEVFPLLPGPDRLTERFRQVNTRVANHIAKGYRPYVISIHHNAVGSREWSPVHGVETFHHPQSEFGPWIARAYQEHLVQTTGRRNRGVKKATFQVLRQTNCPAILLEAEFFSHRDQALRMIQGSIQQETAVSISDTARKIYHQGIPGYAKGATHEKKKKI